MLLLALTVGDDLIHLIDPEASLHEVWEELKNQLLGGTTARQLKLTQQLSFLMKDPGECLESYVNRSSLLSVQLNTAGIHQDEQFTLQFLNRYKAECDSWVLKFMSKWKLPSFHSPVENL
jgi:hypothetical protein